MFFLLLTKLLLRRSCTICISRGARSPTDWLLGRLTGKIHVSPRCGERETGTGYYTLLLLFCGEQRAPDGKRPPSRDITHSANLFFSILLLEGKIKKFSTRHEGAVPSGPIGTCGGGGGWQSITQPVDCLSHVFFFFCSGRLLFLEKKK